MRASVFIAASMDGFIARPDGGLDWLPGSDGEEVEEHGYQAFIASVDVVIMGRGTYDLVMTFGGWPFSPKLPVRVLTTRPITLPPYAPPTAKVMSGEPAEILAALDKEGFQHAYIDGGKTIQGFLSAGLIQRMIVTRIPVLIGEGIPLFGSVPGDIRLKHVRTSTFAGGLVQSEYEVGSSDRRLNLP
jgi:dihydrofolate reductase